MSPYYDDDPPAIKTFDVALRSAFDAGWEAAREYLHHHGDSAVDPDEVEEHYRGVPFDAWRAIYPVVNPAKGTTP